MLVNVYKPALMDAKVTKGEDDCLLRLTPRRFSKGQSKLYLMPLDVVNDKGERVSSVMLSVSAKTGKLTLEDRLEEIPCDVDEEPAK